MNENFDDLMDKLEKRQKVNALRLPSFRTFKDMYGLHQTRVVEKLIDTDVHLKKVDDLSLNIIKYAISHRDKVHVSNELLDKLYRKYSNYFRS